MIGQSRVKVGLDGFGLVWDRVILGSGLKPIRWILAATYPM